MKELAADLHTLTGAYALHALPDDERAAFERHLGECEACAREIAEFAATAARLATAAAVPPRPVLRVRVLGHVADVQQDPPAPPVPPPGTRPHRTHRAARRGRRLSRWALAACLAAAALGGTAVWQYQRAADARTEAGRSQREADEVAAVLAASDARSRTVRLSDGGTGTVVVSARLDRAVFLAVGMAEPPGGKVYQLWFDDRGVLRDAGLMAPHRARQAVLLRGAVDGASGVGVTLEPAGGSSAPTSEPVALLSLPA
ncbi:anti-sigma factor [Streptomyces sp. NBC_01275]|uniref:anti-sigma factor n=1 Tax=Streptomyces sp. NBC_01275 TaxID=2903807 RepID=UPI002250FF53|nr:anti-sigma factor [Streptomyces sp. NBC_01275]MCX4767478.1 anti-sigma factor [Streptomyces sp. NBC_01275]